MKKVIQKICRPVSFLLAVLLPVLVVWGLWISYERYHRKHVIPVAPEATKKAPRIVPTAVCDIVFVAPAPGKKRNLYPAKVSDKDSVKVEMNEKNHITVSFKRPGGEDKRVIRCKLIPGKMYGLHIYADPLFRRYALLNAENVFVYDKYDYGVYGFYSISTVPENSGEKKDQCVSSCKLHISTAFARSLFNTVTVFAGILLCLILLHCIFSFSGNWTEKTRIRALKTINALICGFSFIFCLAALCYYRDAKLESLFFMSLVMIFLPVGIAVCKVLNSCCNDTAEKRTGKIFFLLFCIMMVLPLLFLSFKEISETDRRELKKMPSFLGKDSSINVNCGKEFEEYFSDHIGGRELMLFAVRTLKNRVNIPIYDSGVWIGKEDWYYYSIQEYLNNVDWNPGEKEYIVDTLKKIAAFCKKNNIKFYLLICPVKAQIYPSYIRIFKKMRPESFRLVNILKEELKSSPVTFIDPTEYLQKIASDKNQPLLYYKGDHHSSDWGGYHIYRYAMEKVQKDLKKLPIYEPLPKYFAVREARFHGTLDMMQREQDHVTKYAENIHIDAYYKMGWPFLYTSPNKDALYRLGFFGDSFTYWLVPYLTMGSFQHVFSYPASSYKIVGKQLKNLKCDALLLEVWEGALMYWAKKLKFEE